MTIKMDTQTHTLEDIGNKRKRLIFRSWHRGTREMDLLMGSFADAHINNFDEAQLDLYEEILNHSDPDLYNWISGREDTPANYMNEVMALLLAHKFVKDQI